MPKKAKSSALGQFLGYSLQPIRACFYLLDCAEDAIVAVEHLDDVSISSPDGTLILEQIKSATSQNPVSDFALDLWKTFGNWLTEIESGNIDAETTYFRIHVTPIRSGKFVTALHNANSNTDVDLIVKKIEQRLKNASDLPACAPNVQRFLSADADIRSLLVKNFSFESKFNDPIQPIRDRLSVTVPPELLDACTRHAIGIVSEVIDGRGRTTPSASIAALEFRQQLRAFIQKNNSTRWLPSKAPAPGESEIVSLLTRSPMFVVQLDLIAASNEQKMRAASDFLQASAEKTRWAEDGDVVPSSFQDFDNDLLRQFDAISTEIHTVQSDKDEKARGRVIYARCCIARVNLEGREVPGHFVPGCYSSLADRMLLGWHVDFKSLLAQAAE